MRPTTLLLSLTLAACGGSGTAPMDGGSSTGGDGSSASGHDGATGGSDGASRKDAATPGDDAAPSDGAATGGAATIGPCRIFPPDNPWNQDVSSAPLHAMSATYIARMAPTTRLHPDWGTVADQFGIPYTVGTGAPPQHLTWTAAWGPTESDKLACADGYAFCYPIPLTALIEGGPAAPTDSDRHLLYLDTAGAPNDCTLYELYNAQNPGSSGWTAQNGAIFHLGGNALRPDGWTSADAAGLAVLPGLVRWDEVKAGAVEHAIRFTMSSTSQGYIHPATHAAGLGDTSLPPMGLRLRLKASVDLSSLSPEAQIIGAAMKRYGLLLADNGSDWYIGGDTSDGWGTDAGGGNTVMDNLVTSFGALHGSDFEVVDTGPISTAGL